MPASLYAEDTEKALSLATGVKNSFGAGIDHLQNVMGYCPKASDVLAKRARPDQSGKQNGRGVFAVFSINETGCFGSKVQTTGVCLSRTNRQLLWASQVAGVFGERYFATISAKDVFSRRARPTRSGPTLPVLF